jgi:predicted Zn finger-like uncharacterized protein
LYGFRRLAIIRRVAFTLPESPAMNTACPSCGAIYAVAAKDIGRKIKCKKCSTALKVDDTGLVVDTPTSEPPPLPTTPVTGNETPPIDDSDRGRRKRRDDYGPRGGGFGGLLQAIGGVPTILFGLGIFFTLYFFFQPQLSSASLNRADGGLERITAERDFKLRKWEYEEKKLAEDHATKAITFEQLQEKLKDVEKEKKKINKDYEPKIDDARDNKTDVSISGKRWAWFDQFGLMLGFLLLSFGCLAYVRADTHLHVRILGGVILVSLMMAIFSKFAGCRGLGG